MSDNILPFKDLDHFLNGCARQRIASVGCAVIPRLQGILCHFLRHGKGTHGNSVSDGFRHGDNVRLHSESLPCKHGTCPRHTALDLVTDHQDVIVVADLPYPFHEFLSCQMDPAFSLKGFQDDSAGLVADQRLHAVQIIEFRELYPGEHRFKRLPV